MGHVRPRLRQRCALAMWHRPQQLELASEDEVSGDDRGRSPRGAGGYATRAADEVERRINQVPALPDVYSLSCSML